MTAYYNENDPRAAEWLRNLILWGAIAPGEVDERSIEDVRPNDLRGFTQCHFFAGISGWGYALRLAEWSDDCPVWTGSCPCQPFSAAGKGAGFADERHLWPAWFHLIRVCRPERIFGEQVASALEWLDLVSADLEGEGYAIGASVVGAHSVGAPHIRQRLYWMAVTESEQSHGSRDARRRRGQPADGSGLGIAPSGGRERFRNKPAHSESMSPGARGLGNANSSTERRFPGPTHAAEGTQLRRAKPQSNGPWATSDFIPGHDGKWRPVEPGTFPLAHGVPGRVGLLRGYGNAIVPQVAAAFIEASMA